MGVGDRDGSGGHQWRDRPGHVPVLCQRHAVVKAPVSPGTAPSRQEQRDAMSCSAAPGLNTCSRTRVASHSGASTTTSSRSDRCVRVDQRLDGPHRAEVGRSCHAIRDANSTAPAAVVLAAEAEEAARGQNDLRKPRGIRVPVEDRRRRGRTRGAAERSTVRRTRRKSLARCRTVPRQSHSRRPAFAVQSASEPACTTATHSATAASTTSGQIRAARLDAVHRVDVPRDTL